ncbi:acyl carrier protein [Prosthecobacter sp.]|jgi:acyl carrier protein|uniref:acyl carrier protein n=1 Tax=Prosthecobacter sp. TaxID=1965333 RepID=UPI0037C759DF
MPNDTIEIKLRRVFSQVLGLSEETVDDATAPDNTAQWDSLAHLRLVMAVEEEFGITIPAEQIMDMISFKIARLMVEEQAAS